jgi:hypothetical protein
MGIPSRDEEYDFPIAPEYSGAKVVDIAKLSPTNKNQQQKVASMNPVGATLLESVSGGFWMENIGAEIDSNRRRGTKPASYSTAIEQSPVSKRTTPSALKECVDKGRLTVIWPNDPIWENISSAYNQPKDLIKKNPAAMVVVATVPKEVVVAVKCAAKSKVPVQARAGSHSYADFSSGSGEGGIVIDLRFMDKMEYDKKTDVVIVGGGIRLGL